MMGQTVYLHLLIISLFSSSSDAAIASNHEAPTAAPISNQEMAYPPFGEGNWFKVPMTDAPLSTGQDTYDTKNETILPYRNESEPRLQTPYLRGGRVLYSYAVSYRCNCYGCSCGKGCSTTCCSTCYTYYTYCTAGRFNPGGQVSSASSATINCPACPAGQYQPNTKQASCLVCPKVRYDIHFSYIHICYIVEVVVMHSIIFQILSFSHFVRPCEFIFVHSSFSGILLPNCWTISEHCLYHW
jgi:hypothetical protein